MLTSRALVLVLLLAVHLAAQSGGWVQVTTTGPRASPVIAAHDTHRSRLVFWPGTAVHSQTICEVFEWDGTSWTSSTPSGPSARGGHAMVYDQLRQRVVLFGGYDSSTNPSTFLNDAWAWGGTSWTTISASTRPAARAHHAMAYDSTRGVVLLHGGTTAIQPVQVLADTWELSAAGWTQRATTGPSPRVLHAMAFDAQRNQTVLFGGSTDWWGGTSLGDTWTWDGNVWTPRMPVATPGPLARHTMTFSPQRGVVVLVGNNTWIWDGAWARMPMPTPGGSVAATYNPAADRVVLLSRETTLIPVVLVHEWDGAVPTLPSTGVPFGTGCGSPPLTLDQVPTARPTIGTTAQCALSNVTSTLTFVALGWSRTALGTLPLPLALDSFGLPGCELLVSAEVGAASVQLTSVSTATYSLALPNILGLIGVRLYLQGWGYAPGVNPGHTVVSNGLEWVVGNG